MRVASGLDAAPPDDYVPASTQSVKTEPFAGRAFAGHIAAHQPRQAANQRQAQAPCPRSGGAEPSSPWTNGSKMRCLLRRRDADAVVSDLKHQPRAAVLITRDAVTAISPSLVNLAAFDISCSKH